MGRARKLVAAVGLTVGLLSVPAVAGAVEYRDFPNRAAFDWACAHEKGRVGRFGPDRLVCDDNDGLWGWLFGSYLFAWASPLAVEGAPQPASGEPGFW